MLLLLQPEANKPMGSIAQINAPFTELFMGNPIFLYDRPNENNSSEVRFASQCNNAGTAGTFRSPTSKSTKNDGLRGGTILETGGNRPNIDIGELVRDWFFSSKAG
jgi:hypothetical protein